MDKRFWYIGHSDWNKVPPTLRVHRLFYYTDRLKVEFYTLMGDLASEDITYLELMGIHLTEETNPILLELFKGAYIERHKG